MYSIKTGQVINNIGHEFLYFLGWMKHTHSFRAGTPPEWFMVHMIRREEVPAYDIWKVWIEVCAAVTQVSFEVPIDKYWSTSVYRWDHSTTSDDFYMTFDEVINVLFEAEDLVTHAECNKTFTIWFVHFMYDDRMTQHVSGENSDGSYFTFHKLR